uniref:Gamma-glutamylcyclotransferase n=1 Tax=Salarias fasciatus TaxID=181472 RepID=A0A672JAQ6_SALFA
LKYRPRYPHEPAGTASPGPEEANPQDIVSGKASLWIFGYGSLVWKPDFKYKRSKVGYIQGYKRRVVRDVTYFYFPCLQPGRVVTLIEEDDASTWGVAFEVTGSQMEESLSYLNVLETACGGYITRLMDFFPDGESHAPVQALVYIATSDNPRYLGPGKTGHNLEYLLRLAEFMRSSCPHVEDHHLFAIEAAALTVVSCFCSVVIV